MTVYRLGPRPVFPPPEEAEPSGLLAVGGDLAPERLVAAYAAGIFPWYEEPPILWFSPDPRMALEPGGLHVPRRLARTLRQGRFELSLDRAFSAVIRGCAETRREGVGDGGTWITPEMIEAYERLFELGVAHSCEAWQGGELAGGLYGVSLGAGFFGESMFFRRRDASKAALVALVLQLEAWGFELFDCQMYTAHVARFGATEWPRERFLAALERALARPTRPGPWRLEPETVAARLRPGGR